MTGTLIGPVKLVAQADYWRRHGRPDVAQRIEHDLIKDGRCRRCGRKLTDPASLARGVGPDCWASWTAE